MFLRIKLPAQKPPPPCTEEHMEEQPAKRKRSLPKRYQYPSDDDDDQPAGPEPVHKAPRTATSSKSRRQSTAGSATSAVADVDVVVMNDVEEADQEPVDDHHSEHSAQWSAASTSTSQLKATLVKGKAVSDAPPPRKKSRKVVVSDSEEEDEYLNVMQDVVPEPEEEDDGDYFSLDERPTKISKGKGKAPSGKSVSGSKGTKRKAKADPEEAQPPLGERKGFARSSAAAKKRLKPSLKVDDTLIDVVGDSVGTPEAPPAIEHSSPAMIHQDSPAPTAPPKKMKLPTIKKTKLLGTSGLNTPTSATASKKPPLEIGASNKDGSRKNNLLGNTDIDLSNKSIYQELFSKTGNVEGGTPRRAKEEERRKELNRMRDEAKAKRTAEALHSFDLQAQFDKISRFEEKLRAERSSALYPNFLAAKWREAYEKEKRRQRSQEWNDTVYVNGNGREEGEVS